MRRHDIQLHTLELYAGDGQLLTLGRFDPGKNGTHYIASLGGPQTLSGHFGEYKTSCTCRNSNSELSNPWHIPCNNCTIGSTIYSFGIQNSSVVHM